MKVVILDGMENENHIENILKELLEDVAESSSFKLALEDVFGDKKICPKAQDVLEIKMPKVFLHPVAIYLNQLIKKTARQYGVKDVGRRVYLE